MGEPSYTVPLPAMEHVALLLCISVLQVLTAAKVIVALGR